MTAAGEDVAMITAAAKAIMLRGDEGGTEAGDLGVVEICPFFVIGERRCGERGAREGGRGRLVTTTNASTGVNATS